MAIPTFEPPRSPDAPASRKTTSKSYMAEFGDGYTQRTPKGINNLLNEVDLSWTLLDPSDVNELETFFQGLKGVDPFDYAPPFSSVLKRWYAPEWERISNGPTEDFRVRLIQVYDN